jgi:hypothetical protein
MYSACSFTLVLGGWRRRAVHGTARPVARGSARGTDRQHEFLVNWTSLFEDYAIVTPATGTTSVVDALSQGATTLTTKLSTLLEHRFWAPMACRSPIPQ